MDYMTMNFNRNGGGGGTTNYNQLTNKPSINDVTLSGNKTASDLGLMPTYEVDTTPTESSENLITSGGVWTADKNIDNKLQGSKTAGSTDGSPFEIPDYGMTESIQMYFKPTQDLHGHDKPWAGGAGKNKFNPANYAEDSFDGTTYTDVAGDGAISQQITLPAGTYTFSVKLISKPNADRTLTFATAIYGESIWGLSHLQNQEEGELYQGTVTFENETSFYAYLYGSGGGTFKIQIQIESGNQATDFEPYSNICPISGQDNATFSWTDSHDIENEVTMNFGNTYYGGFCQFDGQIYPDWDYIASYNGETLSGEWVSDRDEYQAGTTPTIGAEVAYKTTPSYVRVTPPANLNLTDDYPIEYNGYMASIGYQPKNTVLAEAKRYTNQEIAKLGLPQAPTTDGTYHLGCSVSSGIPTITWVLNS